MLRLTVNIAGSDTARRLIEGLAVPWNEVAEVGPFRLRFAPGSLELARDSTPLLLGHDTNKPVGILSGWTNGEDGARARFRVDRTTDGDTALAQAKSGSRAGLSIGFELDDAETGEDGITEVTAASVYEVSLVSVPAFADSRVERVAAERQLPLEGDEPGEPEPDEEPDEEEHEEEPAEEPAPDTETEEEDEMDEVAERRPMILAERGRNKQLTAGEIAMLMIRAQRGEREAATLIQAALVETISTDVTGVLPPQYERELIGVKTVDRVLYDIFRGRPLPGVGLTVNKPVMTTGPAGAWAATVDADATSSTVTIGVNPANVERWDWAGSMSYVSVQRSDPDLLDTIYSAAVLDFYSAVEAKIAAQLVAGATAGVGTTLGAAIAEFYASCSRSPEWIIVAPDVWGSMADLREFDAAVAGGEVSGVSGLTSTFAGIRIAASGALAAGTRYLATRRALDVRITDPVRLTANAIGALNVELGVVGEGLFDVDYGATTAHDQGSELLAVAAPVVGTAGRGKAAA